MAAGRDLDALWERARPGYRNIAVRDAAFVEWRFLRPPTRSYRVLAARSGSGALEGYLAWRMTSFMGLGWAMLVDLFVPEDDGGARAGRALVGEFVRRARADGAAVAAGLMFGHHRAASHSLRAGGFVVCPRAFLPREFPVLLHWNGPGEPPPGFFFSRSWYLTLGDYDAV